MFKCRFCNSTDQDLIISLGNVPLANSFLTEIQLSKPEKKYPLDLVFCHNCNLVQITETVDPDILFSEYVYFSSFSDALLVQSKDMVDRVIADRELDDRSNVLEIGSNDGYLLKYYKQIGIPVLGVDPAKNVTEIAEKEHGIPTISEYFDTDLARSIESEYSCMDVIHANNVLAHVAGINDFVIGVSILLKPDGVCIVEVPYIKDLIDKCEFDTIYHEHLFYFSLSSLRNIFSKHSLFIQDVEHIQAQGGSLRIFVGYNDVESKSVIELLNYEKSMGLGGFNYYHSFGEKVKSLRQEITGLIQNLKDKGNRISAYGASAKSTIFLNYFGIGKNLLDYIVDISTIKQGLFTPGTHLPIYNPSILRKDRPDYLLLLAWNLADEILEQQSKYRDNGGKFIIPIPEFQIV